ncbi:hypothetical protein [Clostridium sp. LP20]|uniref:hypothetical protein n=1 Tax=Clostridium sp. LP20 TaxID=3418665 RepID=UPI003EE539EB
MQKEKDKNILKPIFSNKYFVIFFTCKAKKLAIKLVLSVIGIKVSNDFYNNIVFY